MCDQVREWCMSCVTEYVSACACVIRYTLLLSAIPVQLAAFLMTCVRKSIMSAKGWHYWYSFSFMLALSSITNVFDLIVNLAYGTLLYCLRRHARLSKYIIWGVVSLLAPALVLVPQGNPFLTTSDMGGAVGIRVFGV